MKKYFIISIAVAALFAGTMPVRAETGFNQMSKCIQNLGKGGGACAAKSEAAPAKAATKAVTTTDTLGNKIPVGTDNSGKTRLGV